MPTVPQFEAEHPGEPQLKSPHGIAGQCVSVPSLFAVENGWPELFGPGDDTAQHIWQNGVPGYDKIVNTPSNFPSPGDFVFFSYNHVVLVESANNNTIVAFEQNDPTGRGAHRKSYGYFDVEGWFHHPSTPPAPQPTPPANNGTYPVRTACNVRTSPHVTAPIVAQLHVGTVHVNGIVPGDSGTVGNHTSNQWGITDGGHYFNMAATQ